LDEYLMNDNTLSKAQRVAAGAAIGLVAGLTASFVMDRFQALIQPPSESDVEPSTEKVADGLARRATGSPLLKKNRPAGGQAVHYGLGAMLGVGYGIAAEFDPRVTTGFGAAFGTCAWAILDEVAVPTMDLGDAPWKSPIGTQAYGFVSHLVFGSAAELTRRLGQRAAGL
jgi:uncharacterized membrane protein YagU involved in acid resistance